MSRNRLGPKIPLLTVFLAGAGLVLLTVPGAAVEPTADIDLFLVDD